MRSTRKGQGLSVNVMIVAVLALVVLVVLVVVFSSEGGKGVDVLTSCEARNGVCSPVNTCPDGRLHDRTVTCPDSDWICCVQLGGS